MELHQENEPLLNKDNKDSYINIDEENNKKSKEKIINKSCDKDYLYIYFFVVIIMMYHKNNIIIIQF